MKLSNNLIPIISKNEFDDVAENFLETHFPQALKAPIAIPIEEIAIHSLKLQIKKVHLSEDLSILGQIFFSRGLAEVYLKDTDEFVYEPVEKGMMFVDPDVATEQNIGRERNTIAHECVHWCIHRSYHTVQIIAGGEKAVAFRCPIEPPSEKVQSKWSDIDWMEWQANGIAPKILMPKNTFLKYIEEHPIYTKMKSKSQSIFQDLLIDEIADFFQVSKQSASIRLMELDVI